MEEMGRNWTNIGDPGVHKADVARCEFERGSECVRACMLSLFVPPHAETFVSFLHLFFPFTCFLDGTHPHTHPPTPTHPPTHPPTHTRTPRKRRRNHYSIGLLA